MKILVVRRDRLGDVVLSTPVFEAIKRAFPKAHITVWIKDFVKPLIEGNPYVDQVVTWDLGWVELVRKIRQERFDAALVLKSEAKVGWALLCAGVPLRVGPLSKPHSFFVYNRGLRQRRSRVEMHEADYNLQLASRLGMAVPSGRPFLTRITLQEEVRRDALSWLNEQGWSEGSSLVAVHPGMGGSALNWPEENYVELVRGLSALGQPVLVTAGATEDALLARFRKALGELETRVMFYGGAQAKGIDFLAGLFSWASVVVAPSTGPLHIAVALGKPVVSFYPPIRVQSEKRWGPYVANASLARVLVPKSPCDVNSCMESLPVEDALEYTLGYL